MGRTRNMYRTKTRKVQPARKGKQNVKKTGVMKYEEKLEEPNLSAIVLETEVDSDEDDDIEENEDGDEEETEAEFGEQEDYDVCEEELEDDEDDEDGDEEESDDDEDSLVQLDPDDEVAILQKPSRNRKSASLSSTKVNSSTTSKAVKQLAKKGKKKVVTANGLTSISGTGSVVDETTSGVSVNTGIAHGQVRETGGTSISTGTSPTVVRDLSSFGITAAPGLNVDVAKNPSSSKLRIVVINGLNGHRDIIFRCEPTLEGSNVSSWCEKVLADAIRTTGSWTSSFNISQQTFNWYDGNKLQLNGNGYPIRLFHMAVLGDSKKDEFLDMWTYLCDLITNTPRNTERMLLDCNDLYWRDGPTVWADVIGVSKALSMIRFHRGSTYQGFYEANRDFILTYFREEDVVNIPQLYPPASM